MSEEHNGTLQSWRYDSHYHVVWGMIEGDTKGRFADGAWIHTSWLRHNKEEVGNFKEGDIISTRNSKYKLGTKAQATTISMGLEPAKVVVASKPFDVFEGSV